MKKIAVASDKGMVSQHFGFCEGFTMFETENQQITGQEFFANPGHRPGFLPNFLNDQGVHVVIAGGMGGGAVTIFNEKGIEVITGVSGTVQDAAMAYLQGILQSSGTICHEHHHADSCGG